MKILDKPKKYKWEFENIGGSTRIKLTSGSDIAHLHELDKKMWTVLSCPVKGLEIDSRSLEYIDSDKDGKIHLDDIVNTSLWITGAIKDPDLLINSSDSFNIDNFNRENEVGDKLYRSSRCILDNLGKGGSIISLNDISDSNAIFAKTRFNGDGIISDSSTSDPQEKLAIAAAISTSGSITDRSGEDGIDTNIIEKFYTALKAYSDWSDAAAETPFGNKTEAVIDAYQSLDSKIKDFFMRSRLAAFSPENAAGLDVQAAQIQSISTEDLSTKSDIIANYPLAKITGKAEIQLNDAVNPAWSKEFAIIREAAAETGIQSITEESWGKIKTKFSAYSEWKSTKQGAEVESLGKEKVKELLSQNKKEALLALVKEDMALKEESDSLDTLDKFLHIYRDFYTLLKNFVTFQDFYNPKKNTPAIFQCGQLIIDQRACHFCMDVIDMPKHNTMAPASGMFLIYCDCTTKTIPGIRKIVAAVTVGDIGDLSVGKNAIFYDNSGLDWDAVITKIIENPISIAQAFWSPYRRMAKAVENLINKSAAEKDARIMAETNKKLAEAQKTPLTPATTSSAPAAPPFDIAKFAGIFAAIGMAVGALGTALVKVAEGFASLQWWKAIIVVIGILLVISGPSMIMAWLKLRRRNIAPLLNANGWAINASSNISIQFGATLTDAARFPRIKLKDPYARKGMSCWQKWLISIAFILVLGMTLWLCNALSWAGMPSPFSGDDASVCVENIEINEMQ